MFNSGNAAIRNRLTWVSRRPEIFFAISNTTVSLDLSGGLLDRYEGAVTRRSFKPSNPCLVNVSLVFQGRFEIA